MTTVFQLRDNIQQKLNLTEKAWAIFSESSSKIEAILSEKGLWNKHDILNYNSVSNTIDQIYDSMDRYNLDAECIMSKKVTKQEVKTRRNIYDDNMFTFQGLLSDDLPDLKKIFYDTYYEVPNIYVPKTQISPLKRGNLKSFQMCITRSGILEAMDCMMRKIKDFQTAYCIESSELDAIIAKYNSIHIDHTLIEDVYDVCECGHKMIVQSNSSEMMCLKCGMTTLLVGSVTEESQLFAQEGNRVAHGSYDPSRHCKFWIERIQAKESTIIPQEHIDKIRESINKDKITNLKGITVKQFRMYLKQNDLSKLNDHIPLIKKIITGYVPPQLTHVEQQLLFIYFDKATKTYELIKPANKKNSLYYPFLIYKILELIVKEKDRREGLLSSIHLQSYETLVENDIIWQAICDHNKCLQYRPTNRN